MKLVVSHWLEQQFLDWQSQTGSRQTISDFADYLSVGRVALTNWMNGKRIPSGDSVKRIAEKLGPQIYRILGLVPPDDEKLLQLLEYWDELSEKEQEELLEEVAQIASTKKDD